MLTKLNAKMFKGHSLLYSFQIHVQICREFLNLAATEIHNLLNFTTYIFSETGFRWLLTMSDISTACPFCISDIFVARFAIAILWYSLISSMQSLLAVLSPHWHVTFTMRLQAVSGQGGSWQGASHGCPHTGRSSTHFWVQVWGQSPAWHSWMHLRSVTC